MDFRRILAFFMCVIASCAISASVSYMLRLRAMGGMVDNNGMSDATVSDVTRTSLNNGTLPSAAHFPGPGRPAIVNVKASFVQSVTLAVSALAVFVLSIGGFALFFKHHENQLRQWYMHMDVDTPRYEGYHQHQYQHQHQHQQPLHVALQIDGGDKGAVAVQDEPQVKVKVKVKGEGEGEGEDGDGDGDEVDGESIYYQLEETENGTNEKAIQDINTTTTTTAKSIAPRPNGNELASEQRLLVMPTEYTGSTVRE